MKNIRVGVFETNSSSTHSISIVANSSGILDSLLPNEEDAIFLTGGEFGWEWQKYNDALTKANYCAVDAQDDYAKSCMLVDVISEHTGVKKVILQVDSNGYIDHQSVGTTNEIFESSDKLKHFIFDKNSWLFTGNDNEDEPPNFFDVDENTVYTHEVKLDGVVETIKFYSVPSEEELQKALEKLLKKSPLYCGKSFIIPYDEEFYSIDGKSLYSWSELDRGIALLFKLKSVYDDSEDKFLGYKVLDCVKIKFEINPISVV